MMTPKEADVMDEVVTQDSEHEAEKPKRRGRPKGSGRMKKAEEVENSEELIFAAQLNEERLNNRFENIKADLNSEINNGLLEVEREDKQK